MSPEMITPDGVRWILERLLESLLVDDEYDGGSARARASWVFEATRGG
jgi:hypothetical protein